MGNIFVNLQPGNSSDGFDTELDYLLEIQVRQYDKNPDNPVKLDGSLKPGFDNSRITSNYNLDCLGEPIIHSCSDSKLDENYLF